jgi:porphyrinogen peroxidase
MLRHQHGIFAEGTRAHHHLELALSDGAPLDAVRRAISATRGANADHRTAGGTALVVGFGPELWARLAPEAPVGFEPFGGYATPDGSRTAPATQHDVWVWVHGPSTDLVLDVVHQVVAAWADVADVVLDRPSFVYHDSRDLTGFIDGTANPFLDDAPLIALVPDGPAAGGCFAMTMEYLHDLDAFLALPIEEQERVFGRAKPDSASLGAAKPVDSHIARAEVEDETGEELQVYRRSVPWATATERGLHFVSFGADVARFDAQLRRMYGMANDGLVDRLLAFTQARTGSFWFCPSADALDDVAPLPD